MHQKWSTYVYLEADTTIGKFEAGITKFIVTTHYTSTTIYTLHRDKVNVISWLFLSKSAGPKVIIIIGFHCIFMGEML
jgi:hypothetical protein